MHVVFGRVRPMHTADHDAIQLLLRNGIACKGHDRGGSDSFHKSIGRGITTGTNGTTAYEYKYWYKYLIKSIISNVPQQMRQRTVCRH